MANSEYVSYNNSIVTQCQPPQVPPETGHLSLPTDSGLPIDVTNGPDLGLGFDSTVGDGFNLSSSSINIIAWLIALRGKNIWHW